MKKYIYLDREESKKGITLIFGVSETRVSDYKEYFEDRAVEFYGTDIPHYITYDEVTDSIREATRVECFKRGQVALNENEAYVGGIIIYYDPYSQRIVDDKVIDKTRGDYIQDGIITVEGDLVKARAKRENQFSAYQKLSNNLFMGVEDALTDEELLEIKAWRNAWLDVPNNYKDLSIPIELSYPESIDRINYYLI